MRLLQLINLENWFIVIMVLNRDVKKVIAALPVICIYPHRLKFIMPFLKGIVNFRETNYLIHLYGKQLSHILLGI